MKECLVSGVSLPEAYHRALEALYVEGEEVDCPDYQTSQREVSMTMCVAEPLAEPMISRLFIGGPRELEQYRQEARDGGRPAVVISTASPYKFSLDVLKAVDPGRRCEDDREASRILAGMAQESLPDAITALDTLPELHTCACEPGEVGGELLRWIGGGHAD